MVILRIRRGWMLAAAAVACAAVVGCSRGTSPSKRSVASSTPPRTEVTPSPRRRPKTLAELRTTDADIVLGNLDGQIAELDRLLSAQPTPSPSLVAKRASLRYARGRYRGDLEEIDASIQALEGCVRAAPEDAGCALLLAEQSQSMHRFARARESLARARDLGADRARIADLDADLDWNAGRYEAAIRAIRNARAERPSSATWLRQAQLEHDLGNWDDSERAFEAAEDAVIDPSPIPLAHMYVQHGIALTQRGRREEACLYFREAIRRMPSHVAAMEHLAEALHHLGKDDEAIALYEQVVALSDDPEFAHALAELLAAQGQRDRAAALAAKAKAGYARLVVKYPEAMYWHASEYYADVGEPARALELLEKNAVLRPNAGSFVALARAQAAVGQWDRARESITRALETPVVSAERHAVAAMVYRHEGAVVAADQHAARAKEIDPTIVVGADPVRDR